jgi:hypothetical protein
MVCSQIYEYARVEPQKEDGMLDFSSVRSKTRTMNELAEPLSTTELAKLSNEMTDTVLGLIAECDNQAVVFQPVDPDANDTFASNPDEVGIAWTLGHVIVHITASAEESAFLAAEMARGVEFHGRSRYETPWESVTTIAQCRQRLEESRRICLASLQIWPDTPNLEITREFGSSQINAKAQFIMGLAHADSHLAQIGEIVQQAREAR